MGLRGFVLFLFGFVALSCLSARDMVHVTVDLRDPYDWDVDLDDIVEFRLSRLNSDGSVDEAFRGRDLRVPKGRYRIEALLAENDSRATLVVELAQPEVRLAMGISMSNHLNIPNSNYMGQLSVRLTAPGEPMEYTVRIVPIWHNDYSLGVVPDKDWSAEFGPIELGDYVLVVLRGHQVLMTKHVEIPTENSHVRLDLDLKDRPKQ